jgi:predicted nucleotidyltransferase
LRLLLVFGSRARGDATSGSDWDLGYQATPEVDPASLLADLVGLLGSDRIDLVDLDRASAQLRFRAAGEGRALYQADADVFPRFWTAAVSFWCDAGPLLRAGYEDVLARLPL